MQFYWLTRAVVLSPADYVDRAKYDEYDNSKQLLKLNL